MATAVLWFVQVRGTMGCLGKKLCQKMVEGPAIGRGLARGTQTIETVGQWILGVGCPHLGVECLIHQLMKLQMHFGCETSLGLRFKVSLEALAVELGVSSEPLQQSYARHRSRVTWCWLVSLWEKCSKFKIKVVFRNPGIYLPRERDSWLRVLIGKQGFTEEELVCLNKVRLHQPVMLL